MQPSDAKVHNLLVLAGGGVRAVLSNQSIIYTERYCQAPIWRLFQGVYGTSTGAIQALALAGANPMSGLALEAAYEKLAAKVFDKRFLALDGWAGPLYDAEPLETQLRTVLGSCSLGASTIPVGVCTYNLRTREPELWTSAGLGQNQMAWKAARASSAAPTFFSPFGNYVDGGLVANMPCAWAAIDYSAAYGAPLSQIRVLALGTGTASAPITSKQNAGKLGWVEDVIDIGIDGSQQLEETLCRKLGLAGYLEIQIALPANAQAMDDASTENILRLKQLGNQAVGQKLAEFHAFLDAVRGKPTVAAA